MKAKFYIITAHINLFFEYLVTLKKFVSGRSLLNTTEETPESTTTGWVEEKCMTPAIEQFPEPLMPQV